MDFFVKYNDKYYEIQGIGNYKKNSWSLDGLYWWYGA